MTMPRSVVQQTQIATDEPDREHKASSTSSLYIGSTIAKPNERLVIRAVSAFIYGQVATEETRAPSGSDLDCFSEERYVVENPEVVEPAIIAALHTPPTQESIGDFVGALYDCAQFRYELCGQLSLECCIVGMIYVSRLSFMTNMQLTPSNWRPIVLCGFLIAQKVRRLVDKQL